jgi:predicted small lipoprotein YifL
MRRTTTCLLLLTALLAACGQKGALYIPEKKGEAVKTTVTPVAPDTTDADEAERARQEAARRAAGN